MTLPSVDLAKRKTVSTRRSLEQSLAFTQDDLMLQLLWAVNVLQSEYETNLRPYFQPFPTAAARAQLGDPLYAAKWELENLILLLLATPKSRITQPRSFNYKHFDAAAHFINLVKAVDESEELYLLKTIGVENAMQKLGHKQFFWQRELLNIERLYRYYYVYGQGAAAIFFSGRYGISIDEFAIASIALSMQFHLHAWQRAALPIELVRPEITNRTLEIVSMEHKKMRDHTVDQIAKMTSRNSAKLAYLPSTLRSHPVIYSKKMDKMIAPIPQLLIFRATSGLYYDLIDAPRSVMEEANKRFEAYGKKLIEARCPRFEVIPEHAFGSKSQGYRTPDLLLKDEGKMKAVFECKATKLTFAAQYADDPYSQATGAYDQIAKGMAQLWRFFSRARRNIYKDHVVAPDALGIVLTMETWFQITSAQLPDLIAKATQLVANDPDITPQDMRPLVFCSMEEIDEVLAVSDEDEFLETLQKSHLPEFRGWAIPIIRQPAGSVPLPRKSYPFELEEVIPLWGKLRP